MLFKKMLRDLRANMSQFMAIFVMAFISLVVVAGTGVSDYKAVNEYMQDTSYKDIDLSGISFSYGDISSLQALDEVRAVDGYYNTSAKLELSEEIKVLISYISGNDVSRIYVTEGEAFVPGQPGIWLDKKIADAKGINIGDSIELLSEDVRFTEKVRGLCYSSQYMYYAVDSTYVEPAYDQYGFAIMDISRYPGEEVYFDELLVDLEGVDGQLYLSDSEDRTMRRAAERIRTIIDDDALVINHKLEDYQLKTYVDAVATNKQLQILFPTVFGSIALLGIVTTMTRLISRQRTTIGALKALGFTSRTISIHYMSYSLFIVLLGCIAGALAGYYTLGPVMMDMMSSYYLIPYERMEVSGLIIVFSILLLACSLLVTWLSNARVLRLSASQILQPEAPKASGRSWYEDMGFWKRVRFATQWNIRDISGNVFRTLLSILGVVVSSGLVFGSFGFLECLRNQGHWFYRELVLASSKVEFSEEADYGTVYDYAGQYKGQMVQLSPIRLKTDTTEKNTYIYVVDKGNSYFLHDMEGKYIKLPDRGVAMTKKMMEISGAGLGDWVSFTISGDKEVYKAQVTALVRTPMDQGIYMTRSVFYDMRGDFRPNILYTGLSVPKSIEERKEIVSVNTAEALIRGVDSGNESYLIIVAILVILAALLGAVILYNLGSMSYNEKQKDMATLKVLGFRSRDLKVILMQQNIIITGIGTLLGFAVGFGILDTLTAVFGEDVDCLLRVSFMPYAVDICFTFVLSILINLFIVSKLEDINMVETLKGI